MNFRKSSGILLSLALLTSCATKKTDSLFKAGTYSASAAGRNADVKLTVTFSDTAIEKIETEQSETEGIGTTAIETLTKQTIDQQTVPSDVISGATISSNAFINALKDTITQAGGNPETLAKDAGSSVKEYVTEADVVVIGAGGAGLSAALTASEEGASVILLEKSGSVGGNTLAAANGVNAADAKVQLKNQEYKDVKASVDGLVEVQSQNDKVRPDLVQAFAKNSGETIDWISDIGVNFEVEIGQDDRNAVQNYYMLKADSEQSTAVAMIQALKKTLDESNVNLYTNIEATSLEQDEKGTVTGVKAKDADGKEVTFHAKAVILATGGFGQNSELLAKVNPQLANAITDEIAPTSGDGLLMAEAVGAKTVDLGEIQTFPVVIPGYGMVTPNKLPGGFMVDGAIYVNQDGDRFTAEAFESVDAVLSQKDGKAYMIFSEEDLNEDLQNIMRAGFIQSGEDAKELAGKLGVDETEFAKTVDSWNTQIETGTEDAFGRHGGKALKGKLYGFEFGVGAHYFMGGVLINDKTQVLNEKEEPINGLYAAGEVTGGFHGAQRVDGSGLGDSFVFGRIAGRQTAEDCKE